jgi:hypothetical protein
MDEKDVVGRARALGEVEETIERRLGSFLGCQGAREESGERAGAIRALHAPGNPACGVLGIISDRDAGRLGQRVRLARETGDETRVAARLLRLVEKSVDLFRREALATEELGGFQDHEPVRRKERDRRRVGQSFLHALARRLVCRNLALREGLAELRSDAARALGHDPVVVSGEEKKRVKRRRAHRREERSKRRERVRTFHAPILDGERGTTTTTPCPAAPGSQDSGAPRGPPRCASPGRAESS